VVGGQLKPARFVIPVQSYQQLIARPKAMDFVAAVYEITRVFPKEEMYGLTSQLRRGCRLYSEQHCGRSRAADHRRVPAISGTCSWISLGDGDTDSARTAV